MANVNLRVGDVDRMREESEQLLRQYLNERGWREGVDWVWKQVVFDSWKPDAVLLGEQGKPLAAYEIMLLDADRKASLAQVVMEAGIPFMLVFYASDMDYSIVSLLKNHSELSAVAAIYRWDLLSLTYQLVDAATTSEQVALIKSVEAELAHKFGFETGTLSKKAVPPRHIPTFEVAAMHIYLNPAAKYPWREELWGVYDVIWQWDSLTEQFRIAYDGRWELLKTYRLFLRAGRFAVESKEGISTSRSENFYEERE
ncbi:MAG: hypothetical protein ABDI19_05580 [Armatimonadota bacterium]